MTGKAATKDARRRTTRVPVATMEEIPVLSETERANLLAELREAEARIKAGTSVDYDPNKFKRRLLDIYRGTKR
jgi:hypothetical protein